MIASVAGRVLSMTLDAAVVEVGGVGLLVHCTPATLSGLRLGEATRLSTSLVVREDALTLYGFGDDEEKACFELLQSATGVGPKLAQAAIAVLRPAALKQAIAYEDLDALVRVPGIGRKGAARIVIELKDKVLALGVLPSTTLPTAGDVAPEPEWQPQVRAALIGLGYSAREADQAVEVIAADEAAATADVTALLRAALRTLSRS
ncbi:MAG: holliday junction helicase RuvA [Frankiales bacterium]|jgi:Holliday junction DNA helicase RuvA|nr:holliday junction helicase RuvA [Frankiales bacterium]MDX6223081.1 holliday junction helicase RuvA [Frankiales bacterium]